MRRRWRSRSRRLLRSRGSVREALDRVHHQQRTDGELHEIAVDHPVAVAGGARRETRQQQDGHRQDHEADRELVADHVALLGVTGRHAAVVFLGETGRTVAALVLASPVLVPVVAVVGGEARSFVVIAAAVAPVAVVASAAVVAVASAAVRLLRVAFALAVARIVRLPGERRECRQRDQQQRRDELADHGPPPRSFWIANRREAGIASGPAGPAQRACAAPAGLRRRARAEAASDVAAVTGPRAPLRASSRHPPLSAGVPCRCARPSRTAFAR